MKRLWLLNLGAEVELEGRHPSKGARAMSKVAATTLAETLVPKGDAWFVAGELRHRAPAFTEGRAFLATARAVATLRDAGATLDAPGEDVLRRANSRSFSVERFPREDVYILETEGDLRSGGERLLKRELSFAGGGQRRVSGDLDEADRAWLRASLARGPVCVEPWCHIEEELGVPGFVHRDGRVDVGDAVEQIVVGGQWRESRPSTQRSEPDLRESCHSAGLQLMEIGYWGPFNIDAHRSKEHGWTQVSEINARYTMGWAQGWAGPGDARSGKGGRPDRPDLAG